MRYSFLYLTPYPQIPRRNQEKEFFLGSMYFTQGAILSA
jgi:hypothetical protein